MFISIQFPFVDLRPFLTSPPLFVPRYPLFDALPRRDDFERIVDRKVFIRAFGAYRLRGYVPDFSGLNDSAPTNEASPRGFDDDYAQWASINSIWQDEYLYASARRGLRFEALERNQLADGKLFKPRAKIRAIRFSPFRPEHLLWSPTIRIELGVSYSVAAPIGGEELERALADFVHMKVKVPEYEVEGAGKSAVIKKAGTMVCNPLLEQKEALAALIVDATTEQRAALVHHEMVVPGRPLLAVHVFPGELASFPPSCLPVSGLSSNGCQVAFWQMKSPSLGIWLFDVPRPDKRSQTVCRRRVVVRNNTIAVMRYWSELQAALALRRALIEREIGLDRKGSDRLPGYLNRMTRFLQSNDWHGARLATIRSVLNTYNCELPHTRQAMQEALHDIGWQVANKLMDVGESKASIFVSYSHRDAGYLHHLHLAFSTPEFEDKIAYFVDTDIEAGEEWESLLKRRIESASIAILLVSPNFLSSKYIQEVELPAFTDRAERRLLHVLPVLLDGEIPTQGFLNRIQFVNAKPLSDALDVDVRNVFQQNLVERVRSLSAVAVHRANSSSSS